MFRECLRTANVFRNASAPCYLYASAVCVCALTSVFASAHDGDAGTFWAIDLARPGLPASFVGRYVTALSSESTRFSRWWLRDTHTHTFQSTGALCMRIRRQIQRRIDMLASNSTAILHIDAATARALGVRCCKARNTAAGAHNMHKSTDSRGHTHNSEDATFCAA